MRSKYTSGTYKELYLSENNLAYSDKFNSSDNNKITPSGKSHNRWRSSVQRFWLVIVICARKLQTDQHAAANQKQYNDVIRVAAWSCKLNIFKIRREQKDTFTRGYPLGEKEVKKLQNA